MAETEDGWWWRLSCGQEGQQGLGHVARGGAGVYRRAPDQSKTGCRGSGTASRMAHEAR
jgi:hypothetical protein